MKETAQLLLITASVLSVLSLEYSLAVQLCHLIMLLEIDGKMK